MKNYKELEIVVIIINNQTDYILILLQDWTMNIL